MSAPFFSIVIATHSRPDLLGRAIRSVSSQAFDDYEILLVSDEGSGATYDVARRHLRESDVFVKRNVPAGPARSRNIGVELARGRFVLFLDDDDCHKEGFLAALHSRMAESRASVFYWDYDIVTELRSAGQPEIKERKPVSLADERPENLMIYNFIPNNAFAVTAAAAKKRRFDESLRSHEDWEYLIQLLEEGCEFRHLPFSGVSVHLDEASSQRHATAKKSPDWPLDLIYIYRKWPAHDAEQRRRRHNALEVLGHDIAPSAL